MGFIARLLGALSKDERDGIRLNEAEPWRVGSTKDVERFLRALPLLMPEGSIAYFEGTGEPHVAEYLRSVAIPAQSRVAIGTIWPRPGSYHVPVTAPTCEAFAEFLERRPAGYVCSHCHVYRDGVVLLEWHDAFTSDPIYLSRTINGDAVARFAQALESSIATGWTG